MRKRYGDPVAVDLGGLSFEVQMAMRPDVLYGAGIHGLYQIDRHSGAVLPLLIADNTYSIADITADDANVYAVLQRDGTEIVRIPKGGGAPVTLLRDPSLFVDQLVAHDGVVYVLASQELGTPPETTWRAVVVAVPAAGGEAAVISEGPTGQITATATDADGLMLGRLDGLVRLPFAGGPPVPVHAVDGYYVADVEADATGATWTMRPNGVLPSDPSELYALPAGTAAPVHLASVGALQRFATNQLGFYWVDYDHRAIRAIARDDLAGDPFALIDTGDAPMDVVADDHGLAYATNDDDGDLGDLVLHLLPLAD
ncbi:MAG: hypothetical protein JNK64_32490 [Myxococcales bacterium]|nr:hypothetical protein [Myxococcales bacterium]